MWADAARAWLATLARLHMGASAIALVHLVRSIPDYPLELAGVLGTLVLLAVPAVAAFGALWHAPARAVYYLGPVVLLAYAFLLARLALALPASAAGVGLLPEDVLNVRLVPLALLSLPGVLVGTVGAAASLEGRPTRRRARPAPDAGSR